VNYELVIMLDNSSSIKNIIFDFGGVICNIDFEKSYRAFTELGFKNLDNLFSKKSQTAIFDDFEKGKINPADFRKEIYNITKIDISDKIFDEAWNAMILNIPNARVNLLKKLKTKHRIFLLSNTNRIHYDYYLKNFQNEYGFKNFSELFEKAYFSFFIAMKKPDIEIFDFVINENQLKPTETIFIDDSLQHIEAATLVGLQSYHLKNNEDITELF